VRRCHRYLSGRRNHLNYHDAPRPHVAMLGIASPLRTC
jgi:hypothetical protein